MNALRSVAMLVAFAVACGPEYHADDARLGDAPSPTSSALRGIAEEGPAAGVQPGAAMADAREPLASEPAPFPLGIRGTDGVLIRGAASGATDVFSPNRYTRITRDVSIEALTVEVEDTTIFAEGDLLMLWRATGATDPGSGSARVDISAAPTGRFDFHRVVTRAGGVLTIAPPASAAYTVGTSQVIRVPEYQSVTLLPTARLTARVWNGITGGVLAFFVQGDMTLSSGSLVTASGAGFRGGTSDDVLVSKFACANADGIPENGFAPKGEGVVSSWFGPTKAGPPAHGNGGGGGACHNAGGGGGGNGSAGGNGGLSNAGEGSHDVGGRGGAPITFSARSHLMMGGGGGAGEANSLPAAAGGNGGGIVYVRANAILGSGDIAASGQDGSLAYANAEGNGGSGGGAGGTIVLEVATRIECARISANGGSGGRANEGDSPGGGGGAGHLRIAAPLRNCESKVASGVGGSKLNGPPDAFRGATPVVAQPGIIE